MNNYMIKTSLIIVHFLIRRKLDKILDFSVWLRNGSNPADINRLCSHTEKNIPVYVYTDICPRNIKELSIQKWKKHSLKTPQDLNLK